MPNFSCPAQCDRFFKTWGGLNAHLTTSKSCSWFMQEKLKALDVSLSSNTDTPIHQDASLEELARQHLEHVDYWNSLESTSNDPEFDEEDLLNNEDFQDIFDEFSLIPNPYIDNYMEGEAGPGPQTAVYRSKLLAMKRSLDSDEDARVFDIHPTAGKILRHQTSDQQSYLDSDGDLHMFQEGADSKFHPFNSELDWKIAQWAIKEGPGKNAFDRLLKIPGVSHLYYFNNSVISKI